MIALAGCSNKDKGLNASNEVESVPVRVSILERQKIATTLEYKANLVAQEQVFYAPASAGRIDRIFVEVGDHISNGQLLVEMDKTNLRQSEIQLKNYETEYLRAVKLNKTGSISKQKYDAAVTSYEVAKNAHEFLVENTKMLSPFNGVVTGKFFEEKELYNGGAFGGASKPSIISIEKIDTLKANVSMSEQYYLNIKKGTRIELTSTIFPDRVFNGYVNIVYPTIDPSSRTFNIEVLVPNRDEALRPGMYGDINFFIGEKETFVVPAISILKLQGANNRYVFIAENGKAKRVDVELGKRYDDQIEIINKEITPGTQLITTGKGRLVNGTPIRVIE